MKNPFHEGYYSDRDLVGELTTAVKSEGMRMGVYYSGALDWTFQTVPITDMASFLTNGPAPREYADYVEFHFREQAMLTLNPTMRLDEARFGGANVQVHVPF